MLDLSKTDREQCRADIVRASQASLATHQPQLAVAELTAWRETAMAAADDLAGHDTEWRDKPDTVSHPK